LAEEYTCALIDHDCFISFQLRPGLTRWRLPIQ
jgi:hypothetical protein